MVAGQPARSGIDFSAFRDSKLARELIERIRELVGDRTINLMEVCGTHTVSIFQSGLRSLLPKEVTHLSGPGCPVCVTANRDIDHAIALANIDGAIITTFGDMMRVPGSSTSLAAQKAAGDWEHRQPAACLTQKIHRVYLKRRKYRLFLQAQRDFALKSLGIHKGFQGSLPYHPACVCEISVIFFVFRYTLGNNRKQCAMSKN